MSWQDHGPPPRFAAAVLAWLLRDEWETPLGDFEEYFHELADERGVRWARWWYRRQVWQMLPDRLFAKTYWTLDMLKNYYVLAWRNLLKSKLASGFNIFGLSLAVACTMVAYLFIHARVDNEYIHTQGDTIFLVGHERGPAGEVLAFGSSPAPLGPALEADLPQVVRAARVVGMRATVQRGDETFGENVRLVDPGFMEMFTFPLLMGDPAALRDPQAILLSAARAEKYFGDANPIGETLDIQVGDQPVATFTVRGVAAKPRSSTSLQFPILMAYANRDGGDAAPQDDWAQRVSATFIQVAEPGAVGDVAARMEPYLGKYQAAKADAQVTGFTFDNLYDLSVNSKYVEDTIARGVPWAPVIVLSIISVFLLMLACLNYMNISLANANRRLKEIGIRKVVGSNRWQLIAQFLAENTLLCLLALVLGLGLAHGLLIPAFNNIAGSESSLLNTSNLDLVLFLGALLVGVGLLSGAYPAFYISSFQPIAVFRGRQLGGRNRFMQSLLTVQFVLAFITMIVCMGLVVNAVEQEKRDWGYKKDHTLVLQLPPDEASFAAFHDAAQQWPQVQAASGARDHLGRSWRGVHVHTDQPEPMTARAFGVQAGYLGTMGVRLHAGRFFEDAAEAQHLVINEAFARWQGWDEPLGQAVRIDSTHYTVVGVAADFHYDDFGTTIRPAYFYLADPSDLQYLALRLDAGTGTQTRAALEALWQQHHPDADFDPFFQNSVFDVFFQETRGILDIFLFVAFLALIISCMGLYGLAAQHTASRMKEISIRKVLGATVPHLARRLNQRFALLLLAAAVVATPLSYFLLQALLGSIFTYHMEVSYGPFVLAYVLVFTVVLLTLASQLRLLLRANPAETLRSE